MQALLTVIFGIFMVVVMVVAFGLLCSLPVMWLWNGCLVDVVSGVHTITWLQAWGIMVLCGLLFKSSTTSKD